MSNRDLERAWSEAALSCFHILPRYWPRGAEEPHKNGQDIRYSNGYSTFLLHVNELQTVTTEPVQLLCLKTHRNVLNCDVSSDSVGKWFSKCSECM